MTTAYDDSDDDNRKCCHWSKCADNQYQHTLSPNESISEYGKPKVAFDNDAKPHDIVESIMDDEFVVMCIESTNEHSGNDPQFLEKIGQTSTDKKGIDFMSCFLL